MKHGIIYLATNIINNKIYIGQTTKSLDHRIKRHIEDNRTYFHFALKKYTSDNFKWEIIDEAINQNELNEKEKYWIKKYKSHYKKYGYNLTLGGQTGSPNKETSKKLSERQLGKLNHNWKGGNKKQHCIICNKEIYDRADRKYCSRECTVIGQKGNGNPFFGKKHNKNTIDKMSYYHSHRSEETLEKMSVSHKKRLEDKSNHPMYGKKHTEESKEKNKQSNICNTKNRKKIVKLKGA